MTKHELFSQVKSIQHNNNDREERIEKIKTAIAGLGTLPTLTKLREFLSAIKEILKISDK